MGSKSDNDPKVIDKALVNKVAGKHGEVLWWFRRHVSNQLVYLERKRNNSFLYALLGQGVIIVLGLVATVAAAYTRTNPASLLWPHLNIVAPLLISAGTALIALLNFRGSFANNSTASLVLAEVKAQIDFRVLYADADPSLEITRQMIEDWDKRVSTAMANYSQAWGESLTSSK